jgi:hypothetical protein
LATTDCTAHGLILGHLACTADVLGSTVALQPVCPSEWATLVDWNSNLPSEASRYASKAEILKALEEANIASVPLSRFSLPSRGNECTATNVRVSEKNGGSYWIVLSTDCGDVTRRVAQLETC